MDSASLIITISALLCGAVFFVVSLQRKQENKAAEFHKASKYKYRANEAANILSKFSSFPIGEETRKILLQSIKTNLHEALSILPNDQYSKDRLAAIDQQLTNPSNKIDRQPISIPKDPQKLPILLNSFNKLAKYIAERKTIDQSLKNESIKKLNLLVTELKISAYLQQVKQGVRTENFEFAAKRLVVTKKIINRLKMKNERITALQTALHQLEKPIKLGLKKIQLKSAPPPVSSDETTDNDNLIFGQKKKW